MISSHKRFFFIETASCNNGDLRLMDGENDLEGRLEVCMSGQWGTVTAGSKRWTESNSKVVCRYFGYEATSKFTIIVLKQQP